MKKRNGGKFGKKHGTLTDAAVVIADIAHACPHVTRVLPGVISSPRGSSGSGRRVKVVHEGHALRLSVTGNASHQEIRIYATDKATACSWMKTRMEAKGFNFVAPQ